MRFLTLFFVVAFLIAVPVKAQEALTFSEAYKAYNAAVEAGDYEAALPHARAAYELGIERYGEGSKEHAIFAYNLGTVEGRVNGLEAASLFLIESIEIFEKVSGTSSAELLDPLMELADLESVASGEGTRKRGLQHYGRALQIVGAELGNESAVFAETAVKFGNLSVDVGDRPQRKEGREALAQARAVYAKFTGEDSLQTTLAAVSLANAHSVLKDFELARDLLLMAIDKLEDAGPEFSELLAIVHKNLAVAYAGLADAERMRNLCHRAWNLYVDHRENFDRGNLVRTKHQKPVYPQRAQERGIEGSVLLEFTVNSSGTTENIKVIDSCPEGEFDRQSIRAVEKFLYSPRTVNGQAVATVGVRSLVTFELVDEDD